MINALQALGNAFVLRAQPRREFGDARFVRGAVRVRGPAERLSR